MSVKILIHIEQIFLYLNSLVIVKIVSVTVIFHEIMQGLFIQIDTSSLKYMTMNILFWYSPKLVSKLYLNVSIRNI